MSLDPQLPIRSGIKYSKVGEHQDVLASLNNLRSLNWSVSREELAIFVDPCCIVVVRMYGQPGRIGSSGP